jgi:hypothetical protein
VDGLLIGIPHRGETLHRGNGAIAGDMGMCLFTRDGRNSAINEVGGIIFITATQICTRVWRLKTIVLIRSRYPRQSNSMDVL